MKTITTGTTTSRPLTAAAGDPDVACFRTERRPGLAAIGACWVHQPPPGAGRRT